MLKISPANLTAIRRHGEQAYPRECCGVLLGKFKGNLREVTTVIPCGNARDDSPQNRYSIDPRELIRIQREGRELGEDIVGFYHSHPDHAAEWSQTDLAEAYWFERSYLIISVEQGKAGLTKSYELTGSGEEDKTFVEERIV